MGGKNRDNAYDISSSRILVFVAAACLGLIVFNFLRVVSFHPSPHLRQFMLDHPDAFCAFTGLCDAQKVLSTRVCGSPAVDGYAHVDPKCLEESPTAKWWKEHIIGPNKFDELVVHKEEHADYDGLAVVWGIGNTKTTLDECAAHCKRHRPGDASGPFEHLPCNAFAFCPEAKCFEPDAHSHGKGDCWLKFTEAPASPEVNMRGALPESYRQRHKESPAMVQWSSGVLLPPGVRLTNGTWGPRWLW